MSHAEAVAFLRRCPETVTIRLFRDSAITPISPLSPTEPETGLNRPRPLLRYCFCLLLIQKRGSSLHLYLPYSGKKPKICCTIWPCANRVDPVEVHLPLPYPDLLVHLAAGGSLKLPALILHPSSKTVRIIFFNLCVGKVFILYFFQGFGSIPPPLNNPTNSTSSPPMSPVPETDMERDTFTNSLDVTGNLKLFEKLLYRFMRFFFI